MTSAISINLSKGTAIVKLWNSHPKTLKRVQMRFWTSESTDQQPEVDLAASLLPKEHVAFDLLASPKVIYAIQFVYKIGLKRRETQIFKPQPHHGANAYIRDLLCELSEQDQQDPTYFIVFDDAKNAHHHISTESSERTPGLHFALDALRQPSSARLNVSPIGEKGNVAFFDVRNFRDLYMYPTTVNALTINIVTAGGVESSYLLSPAVWGPRLARVEFKPPINCSEFWLSWKLDGKPKQTKRQSFDTPIIWGEAIVNDDGESGGLWLWLDWLQTRH